MNVIIRKRRVYVNNPGGRPAEVSPHSLSVDVIEEKKRDSVAKRNCRLISSMSQSVFISIVLV